ncbi:arrestin domain-containing protein 3-like isoform 1-T1 [Aulostomus maculatus]
MEMIGKAHVHWSTSSSGGRKGRRSRRHFSATLDFFRLQSVLLQERGALNTPTKLQPGTHVYPFTCQLPQGNFPSSFRGVYGQVSYTMTVAIHRPWRLSKDFVSELNFVNHMDTSKPELWAPLAGSNSKTVCCLCCTSGPVTVSASVERKLFSPGETVKIRCEFSNASSRPATPKAKLQQKQGFYTHNRVSQRIIYKTLASAAAAAVEPQTSDVLAEILLTIPDTTIATINNCSILEVEYVIELTLSQTASSDLTVLFPIIISDISVPNLLPPPYL